MSSHMSIFQEAYQSCVWRLRQQKTENDELHGSERKKKQAIDLVKYEIITVMTK